MGASILVGNLSHRTTKKQLAAFFSSWGTVVSVRIPLDRRTGRSSGVGFVEYASEELAELALAVFNGRQLGGRVLRLRPASDQGDGATRRVPGQEQDLPPTRSRLHLMDGTDTLHQTALTAGVDDYTREHRSRRRKGAKHGSDRQRGRGNRRVIE